MRCSCSVLFKYVRFENLNLNCSCESSGHGKIWGSSKDCLWPLWPYWRALQKVRKFPAPTVEITGNFLFVLCFSMLAKWKITTQIMGIFSLMTESMMELFYIRKGKIDSYYIKTIHSTWLSFYFHLTSLVTMAIYKFVRIIYYMLETFIVLLPSFYPLSAIVLYAFVTV